MSAETHKQNARQADADAVYWKKQAEDHRKRAEWCEKQAFQRLVAAADYRGMAEREDRALEQILSQIGKAA